MSLFALPVSVNDLLQLQQGLTFFSDMSEAQTEAAAINAGTDTVENYANTLLANNVPQQFLADDMPLSEVAMAVDSLMFGSTDNLAELTRLVTGFLPAQVGVATAIGVNPIVYAAEALGLALAGGNGTTNPFATAFGSLSVSQFVAEVASLTGIHPGPIQGFVQFWLGFYTANPDATFGLTVTLAAYGAAFGDTVGTALLNADADGTTALLLTEEQNALLDNAEGGYQAGIPLSAEPPHVPLQGEAFSIPNAGAGTLGPTIDWADTPATQSFHYAQFVAPAQSGPLTITRAPVFFTLNTGHFATNDLEIDADVPTPVFNNGPLCTLILGDKTAPENLTNVTTRGYSTVDLVVASGFGASPDQIGGLAPLTGGPVPSDLVISGAGTLLINGLAAGSITDNGVQLAIVGGLEVFGKIDASNGILEMLVPAIPLDTTASGVTVLGGPVVNVLQGSVGQQASTVTFSNNSTGLAHTFVGADNITGGSGGGDSILGDGGADTITLPPNHSKSDTVVFGAEEANNMVTVLSTTDGMDAAYLGSWSASATPTPIPNLFPGPTGGTSADMTTITGFHAGSGGDLLDFSVAAWNGASTNLGFAVQGDLVTLSGVLVVPTGAAQLSAVWVNGSSNASLKTTDTVLRYAPADASLQSAQQLAAQLHTSSDAVALPIGGLIPPGADVHILVAYAAGNNAVNIADVDLVNKSGTPQTSTANVNVYASDMVSLTGVSLSDLASANIHFFTNSLG